MIFIRKYPTQLLINNYIVVSRQHSSYTRKKNNIHEHFIQRSLVVILQQDSSLMLGSKGKRNTLSSLRQISPILRRIRVRVGIGIGRLFILLRFFRQLGGIPLWNGELIVWIDQCVLLRRQRNPRPGYRFWQWDLISAPSQLQ